MAPIPTADAPAERAVACCLLDAAGQVIAEQETTRRFYAASTIKLHVLAAALVEVDEGRLDPAALVPARNSFTGVDGSPFTLSGDHLDPTHPAPGTPIRVSDLLLRMIDRSSNEATNHVLELVGLRPVDDVIRRMGLADTKVERSIGDATALTAGLTNETTAVDLATTMRLMAGSPRGHDSRTLTWSDRSRQFVRSSLRAQQIRVIASALRPGVDVGSKSGSVDRFRHDVAFVGDPEGSEVHYLAVMTQGFDEPAADRRIVDLTRRLLPHAAA